MKILIENPLVWKDAEYKNGHFHTDTDEFSTTDIISVMDFDTSNVITCNMCGKTFIKNSPEWQTHITKTFDINRCATCQYVMRKNNIYDKVTLLENGQVKIDLTCEFKCKQTSYFSPDNVTSDAAKDACIYNRCSIAKAIENDNFFAQYPEAFDSMITIDQVIKHGYKELEQHGQEARFTLKGRYNIRAETWEKNIITKFYVSYRRSSWTIRYSKKYNQFFEMKRGKYVEWNPNFYDISDTALTSIKEKIASLYE